jgi:hypothetical protein
MSDGITCLGDMAIWANFCFSVAGISQRRDRPFGRKQPLTQREVLMSITYISLSHSIRTHRIGLSAIGTFVLLLACMTFCSGCGSAPKANVSDPGVFTAVHLIAAEASVDTEGGDQESTHSLNNGPFTAAHMKRYFESTTQEYATDKLRMDQMLDDYQSSSAFSQSMESSLGVQLSVEMAKVASGSPQAPAAPENKVTADAFKDALDQASKSNPTDSPFDRLDRVSDFYADYVIKSLRVRGDSRAVNQEQLVADVLRIIPKKEKKMINKFAEKIFAPTTSPTTMPQPAGGDEGGMRAALEEKAMERIANDARSLKEGSRLLVLIFQTHVDSGTRPNYMTGVRVHIEKARRRDENGTEYQSSADDVKVIRVHPTRTYDIDSSSFGQTARQAFAISATGSVAGKPYTANVGVTGNTATQSDERRRFLSRVTKVVSYADAANHSFGFNFYPTNVQIEPNNFFGIVLGWLGGTPRAYVPRAYLEGGARDCAVIVIVPRNMSSFTCSVSSISENMDVDMPRSRETTHASQTFEVTLPKWSPWEAIAASKGAAPTAVYAGKATTHQTSASTTQQAPHEAPPGNQANPGS